MKRKHCYVLCGLGIALLLAGCGNTNQEFNTDTESIVIESQSQEMESIETQTEEMGKELMVTEEPDTEIATEVTKEEESSESTTENSSTGANSSTGTNGNTTSNGDTTQNNSVTSSEPTQQPSSETAQQTTSQQEPPYYPPEEEIYKEEYPPVQGDDYQPTTPSAPVENKYVFNEDGTINLQESEIYKNGIKDDMEFLGYLYNSNELKEFLGDQYYYITKYSYCWNMCDYPNILVCINNEYWLGMHFNSDWKLEQGTTGITIKEPDGLSLLTSW